MVLTLVGKEGIYKMVLPEIAKDSYWISNENSGTKKELVNIEAVNGKWQITSNNYQKVINQEAVDLENMTIKQQNNVFLTKAVLEVDHSYYICGADFSELYILYCSPTYEQNFYHLDIKNTNEISIGRGHDNQISYNDKLVSPVHAKLSFSEEKCFIENIDNKYGTYVNNKKVIDKQAIFNGDVIFIMGLKIVVIGKSIYINNPLDKMECNSNYFEISKIKNDKIEKEEKNDNNNEEVEIYSEKDYFSRSPRLTNKIEKEDVKIDPPPSMQSNDETPMILVMGTSLTMGVMSIATMSRTIDQAINGNASTKDTIYQLIISFAMLSSMLIFPMLTRKYDKKRKKKYEQKRQRKYVEYVNSKIEVINNIMEKQSKILYDNYVSADECVKIILNKDRRLWERKIEEFDFLTFRLGIGDTPLNININYPEEKFNMDTDNLFEILQEVSNNSRILKNVPITFSLVEKMYQLLLLKMRKQLINL